MERQRIATDMVLGTIAGSVATVVMSQVSSALYARESRVKRWQETWARGGSNTNTIAARKAARLIGVDLGGERAERAGEAPHHAIGAGAGAAYGVARHHIPAPPFLRGLGFGAALWLSANEVGNPALGITPSPAAFP